MLTPSHRLTKSRSIRYVLKKGESIHTKYAVILWVKKRDDSPSVYAFVASKKIGNAVVRNRSVRVLREAVRLLIKENALPNGYQFVLIAKTPVTRASTNDVLPVLKSAFMRVR